MKFIGVGSRTIAEGNTFDTQPTDKALNPCLNRNVEIDPPGIDEQRNLPRGDRAQENRSAATPAIVDQVPRRGTQAVIAAIEPEDDVRIKQQGISHLSTSRPVSASGSTSRTRARRSTPS